MHQRNYILRQAKERILEQAPSKWRDSLNKYKSLGLIGNISRNPDDFKVYGVVELPRYIRENPGTMTGFYAPAFSGVFRFDKLEQINRRERFMSNGLFKGDLNNFLVKLGQARGAKSNPKNAIGLYLLDCLPSIDWLLSHEMRHVASDFYGVGPFCEFWPNIPYTVENFINPYEMIGYGTWRLPKYTEMENFAYHRFRLVQLRYKLWKSGEKDIMTKTKAMEEFLDEMSIQLFGKSRTEALKERICVRCKKQVGEFSNEISQAEYLISGLCQDCQIGPSEENDNATN